MPIAVPAGRLLKILLDVGDEFLGAALRAQCSAELIVGVGLRLGELIQGLIHIKDGTVAASA